MSMEMRHGTERVKLQHTRTHKQLNTHLSICYPKYTFIYILLPYTYLDTLLLNINR
ncbi:hypothetical protein E2C01_063923 [Portunus trituberculatus]|uniref:Uncharacterized protein n=1 Tax=Portunus trituberculatus TaxID=210409 RepID=A0A5B7HEZ3_PORTR|nr:hypothetical protein [Portunus trituberculatus]